MEYVSPDLSVFDRLKPSFFELAAQEQLRDLLQPVTRYVLTARAGQQPR